MVPPGPFLLRAELVRVTSSSLLIVFSAVIRLVFNQVFACPPDWILRVRSNMMSCLKKSSMPAYPVLIIINAWTSDWTSESSTTRLGRKPSSGFLSGWEISAAARLSWVDLLFKTLGRNEITVLSTIMLISVSGNGHAGYFSGMNLTGKTKKAIRIVISN